MKLFENMTMTEKLDSIERGNKRALAMIRKGTEPSNHADIADAFDYWVPWMLAELRQVHEWTRKTQPK